MSALSCSTFWENWRYFIFPNHHHCCFCPGIKNLEWIDAPSKQHVSTNCFLDKDGHCSLKQAYLFGRRKYFVKEWQADMYLLMCLILCDKIWQSNCEWNNLLQFYGTLLHIEFMPLFKLPKIFKCSKRFLGQNSHKISPDYFQFQIILICMK